MNQLTAETNKNEGLTWLAWQERNHLQDVEGVDRRAKLTKYAAIGVLLLTVVLWSHAADYHLLVRLAVCAAAVRVAFLAAAAQKHAWAAVFAGVAVLYNPVAPLFGLSGRVDFLVVFATLAPFAVSVFARRPRLAPLVATR